jgi:hypothetical protein
MLCCGGWPVNGDAVTLNAGFVGGTPDIRSVLIPLIFLIFLAGLLNFFYSKWIEQPGIKEGAVLVKKLIDEDVNPRYATSAFRLRWTVRVNVQKRSSLHLGHTFVERPIISIYALRSTNDEGVLLDWPLPDALTQGLLFERVHKLKPATIDDW